MPPGGGLGHTQSIRAYTAGEALAAKRRVKLHTTDGEVVYADATDRWIGVTERPAALGDRVAVRLRSSQGTLKVCAAGTFARGIPLFAADDGKVDDAETMYGRIGQALQAATAAGDLVEMLPGSTPWPVGPRGAQLHSTTMGGALAIVVTATLAGAGSTAIWPAVPRRCLVIDAWSRNDSADGGTWKLNDGTDDICSAVTVAASANDIDRAVDIDGVKAVLETTDALYVVTTGAALDASIFVLCLPL